MRVRTYLGFLVTVALVVWASYLTHQNRDLMYRSFRVGETTEVPLYFAFIGLFLIGFLPAGTVLLTRTIQQELALRKQRKAQREEKAQRAAFQRGVDFLADGQPARAVASFQELLASRPDDFVPLLHYGEALRSMGRSEEALETHRRASVLYPHSVAILHHLIEDYEARGAEGVAAEIRARILRDFPGSGCAFCGPIAIVPWHVTTGPPPAHCSRRSSRCCARVATRPRWPRSAGSVWDCATRGRWSPSRKSASRRR